MFWWALAASHLLSLHKRHRASPLRSALLPSSPPPPPPPALFSLPVLPQSSFHSCPPLLPFPSLSSAAVLFLLFLSSFTSMAPGSWVKRCRTEPTGGRAYLTAGSNELRHILPLGLMWGWPLEVGTFSYIDGTANQATRQGCHRCALKSTSHLSLMWNLYTLLHSIIFSIRKTQSVSLKGKIYFCMYLIHFKQQLM